MHAGKGLQQEWPQRGTAEPRSDTTQAEPTSEARDARDLAPSGHSLLAEEALLNGFGLLQAPLLQAASVVCSSHSCPEGAVSRKSHRTDTRATEWKGTRVPSTTLTSCHLREEH